MRNALGILSFVVASSLAAQPLTVGTHLPEPNSTATLSSSIAPVSYVNLTDYASAAGTVNKASVEWSNACSSAFKIVFLRGGFSSASAFTVVAVRGPFNAVDGRNDVTLTPPVTLALGDLIGVVQVQPFTTCGSVKIMDYGGNVGYTLITTTDISTAGTLGSSSNYGPGYRISAVAYNSDPLLVRVLPVVGAAQGAGSFFRTAVQILDDTSSPITGKFVFHKQGQSASVDDPSLAFSLTSGQVISYPDLITTMGTGGVGSLDVVTNGGAQPVIAARIFSDAGVAGTSGFSYDALAPVDAMDAFRRGVLFTPEDPTNFRMNIGVRTLDSITTLSITTFSASGGLLHTRTATYSANYFEQVPFATFTGVSSMPAGGRIAIGTTYPGRAFIYSSVVDNRTQDSTFRLADLK